VWSDSLALWQEAVMKSPNKWLAQSNLAGEYMERKMYDKAIRHFVTAIELNPNLFINAKVYLGDAMKGLNLYESRFTTGQEFILPGGRLNSGALDYKNVTRWESLVSNNLGLAYEYLGQPEKARNAYMVAVNLDPKYDLAWYNLALFASGQGDRALASQALWQLRMVNPVLANALESRLR
jgi:tetratricopeptide (TPR) repeat protein